jgi:hypothetical protein
MLITFTSKVHPDVVMFGDIATVLLRAMGQSEQPPGILRGEDIKVATDRLRAFLSDTPAEQPAADDDPGKNPVEDERKRDRVGLRTRALPLLDMLDASYRKDVDVIWR